MKRITNVLRSLVAVIVIVMALTLITSTPVDAASNKSLKVTNLPSNTVTIKQKKTFKLKTNYATSKVEFSSSKPKVAKVSSKGVIKGIKKGKAQITITLKADKTVKTKINVIIGTPVVKVSLNKASLSLATGKSATLKATVVKKTASNKKVIWTSSDSKIATVNSSGIVKAVKPGTVTITATAADGSGKKASCKVTVAKPVRVVQTKIINPQTVQVKLSSAQALSKSNFNINARYLLNGNYNRTLVIDSVSTADKINYTIKINVKDRLINNEEIRIETMNLFATGTQVVNVVYSEETYINTEYSIYYYSVGSSVDFYDYFNAYGYCDITISGIPDGIKYTINQNQDNSEYDTIHFSGIANKEGAYTLAIKIVDELGNVYNEYFILHIYSADSVLAYAPPEYKAKTGNSVYIDKQIYAHGGSGNYSYSIEGNTYGLSMSSDGRLMGYLYMAGVYNVKVLIKDQNNPSLTDTVTCTLNISDTVTVCGLIKDKRGDLIPSAQIIFINKDKEFYYGREKYVTTSSDTSIYSVRVVPGTYDIKVVLGDNISWIYGKRITDNIFGFDITFDVLKVAVISNNPNIQASTLSLWKDNKGVSYGSGGFIYVVPGYYKLTSMRVFEKATINATITNTTKFVTAIVSERDDIISIKENTVSYAKNGDLFEFTASNTGTYYIYSTSKTGDPYGGLYDSNYKELTSNDDGGYNIDGLRRYDFYIEYKLEAGKKYYVLISNDPCNLHVTTTNPEAN